MKYIYCISIIFFISLYAFSQTHRSEIIKYVYHNEIKGNKITCSHSVILQINERMGDHDTKIAIPYSKGDKVSIGEAWIEDMNGNIIRNLKNKDIKDHSYISDFSLYEDNFVKTFELKHNTYPYRVVYSYKITYSKFLIIANSNNMDTRRPVKSAQIIVETPIDKTIKYKQENIYPPVINTTENTKVYTWNFEYSPNNKTETNSSVNITDAPIIKIVPSDFKFGVEGSFDSWKTFGNWVYRLNRDKHDLTEDEKQKITSLIADVKDNKEKAKILYNYLQDYTRYIFVKMDIGGLQTYPASYVCINKYGDCKALTNYMQAMLKYAGINSYYTLIYSDNTIYDIDEKFPINAFNHAMLTIPFEKDTVYLECTSKNTAFGYIHTSIQGRKALLIDENESRLISIPSLSDEDVLCTRDINVDIDTEIIQLAATERGYNYLLSSYLKSEVNKNNLDRYIKKNILPISLDLESYNLTKSHRDSANITIEATCKAHNLYKKYGNNIILTLFPLNIPVYETPETRKTAVQLDYPEYYKDVIEYKFKDFTISKTPKNIHLKSDYGEYSLTFELKDNSLIIHKSLLINAGRYEINEYKLFYEFLKSLHIEENKNQYVEIL